MNKKRIFILTALILAVCLVFSMFAMACDKKDEDNKDKETQSNLLFTNGTFAGGASDSALTVPSNWTGAPGSTSSSSSSTYTPSGDDDLTKGVVGTSSADWRALQKDYKHITSSSPGRGKSSDGNKELDDDKVLMINNRKATSYKYTSDSHTLAAKSYYKLSVDVKTILDSDNTDALAGAYIYVNGSAYARWEAIDTHNEWKTYTAYIETSDTASGTITVVLSLGIGNGQTGHLTKGYAFFDNVVLEKISEVDEDDENAVAFTKADYDKVVVTDEVAKYTMKVSDSEFDYASSTTSTPYTPSKYTQVAGFGSGESASTSSSYITKGIIDTATFSNEGVRSSLSALSKTLENAGQSLDTLSTPENSVGTRMLYMQNKLATAFGYRADTEMNFDLNKFYKVSVYARTYLEQGKAYVKLTDGTNTDSNDITIEANTNGQWQQISFYIAANQFRSSTLKLELWLGYGGANDTDTHAVGVALFDLTTIEEVSKADYDGVSESDTVKKFDKLMTSYENMKPVDLKDFAVQNSDDLNEELAKRSTFKLIDTDNFTADDYFKENPGKPVDIDNTEVLNSSVLAINNFAPTATTLSTLTMKDKVIDTSKLDNIKIAPNKAYAISMYVKTKGIDKSQGMTISLLRFNDEYKFSEDNKKGQEFEEAFSNISSFSNLNTESLEDVKGFNDYTLITFYVLGEQIKTAKLAIAITIGTGDGSDYSTLAMGYGFVSSMYVESIPYSQYSSATNSTTVKTVTLANTTATGEISSNGYFKNMDISATNNLFGSDILDENGMMKGALALPNNWSINSSSSLSLEAPFNNMAGILNLNNASQLEALGIDASEFYKGLGNAFTVDNLPTVLAIKKNDEEKKLGFTSNSISLSSNSYYLFEVYAKAEVGSEYSIVLKTATANSEDYKFATITAEDNEWHKYRLFIATGISSASVTLSLNAGSDNASNASSTVYFTHATYTSIDEKIFGNAEGQDKQEWLAESWLVDSFDDVDSADSISSAKNFNGELVDSDAKSDNDVLVSGVIDKNKTDYSDLDLDVDGDDEAIVNAIFNNSKTNVGDRALVIYNKDATAYGYTSNTANITPNKYYKISVWVLTYKLALNGDAGDDIDANFVPTATITLKANNKTYEFGKKLTNASTEQDKQRIVNTSTYADGKETIGEWKEYSFYIFAEDDIEDTTATLTVSLGFKGKNYYLTGYVFVDNFSVEEIDEADFIARKDVYKEAENGKYFLQDDKYVEITEATPAPEGAKLYNKLTDSEVAKDDNENNSVLADEEKAATNFRIVFTSEDSKAEPDAEEPTTPEKHKDPLMWLYISLGAVSGIIVIIVVIFIIMKLVPKKKKKLIKNSKNKKTSSSNASKRDQFGK
ncbi:MAG: hypothetical protein K2I23_00320 [Clostridia bacterium]|nr:hypothetical protein [Clostridia bacterium]